MATAIHQEIDIAANPQKIFDALTQSEAISSFTGGAPAEISATEGGTISGFGGMIVGRQVELVPGQRVVQAWRVKNWPEGQYSIARFELTASAEGTRIVFDHTGFPEGAETDLASGWHKMYWDPLRAYLA